MNTVRWTAALLCLLQTLAVSGTVVLVSADVKFIVFVLPVLSLLGLVISAFGCGLRYISLVLFGLSSCITSLYVVYLVHQGGWRPADAAQPVTAVLLYFELFIAPIGLFTFLRVLRSIWPKDLKRTGWRVRLGAFFAVTFAVALLLGISRFVIDRGFATSVWLSAATATAVLEAAILGTIWMHRRRQIVERSRRCSLGVLSMCLVGYAIAPYLSAALVREYPSPITPWESICRAAAWHLPTLLVAVGIFVIVSLRHGRHLQQDAGAIA